MAGRLEQQWKEHQDQSSYERWLEEHAHLERRVLVETWLLGITTFTLIVALLAHVR